MFAGNFSRQHFSASWVWKLLRVQISKWFLLSIADDCANGLWVLANSRERLRSGPEYFLGGACEWDWSTRQYSLPPDRVSENKRSKNRFEELDDCDGCYVAFTVANHTCFNRFDCVIDWLIWINLDWHNPRGGQMGEHTLRKQFTIDPAYTSESSFNPES